MTGAAQDPNVDGILKHLHDYLSVREQQAIRMNSRISNVIDDIIWTEVEKLRQLLIKTKPFGPDRFRVADIFVGDDDMKRKSFLSHSDQNSVIFEIINKADDTRGKVAELAIHDMRTFFRAIDPSLERIDELIQHWILWDLPDAADLHHFNEQMRRCTRLREHGITEEIREVYRKALRRRTEDAVHDHEILQLELKRLEIVLQRFAGRRHEEEAFMMIIRRDEEPYSASNQQIAKLSQSLKEMEKLSKTQGGLSDEERADYATLLGVGADEVTGEAALDYQKRILSEGKKDLENFLRDDRFLGEPYDYKKAQAEQLALRFAGEKERAAALAPPPAPEDDTAGIHHHEPETPSLRI